MEFEFFDGPRKGPEDFATALSFHPIPSMAVGEAVGTLLDKVGEGVDLLCVFVTAAHAGAMEDIAAAVHTLLDPKVMIGCAAQGVMAEGHQIIGEPALVIWAGNVGDVHPLRMEVVDLPGAGSGKALSGWPIGLDYVPAGAVILSDPFGFPVTALFDQLNHAGGFPRVVGAMPAAGLAPGTSRLVLDGKIYSDGAVGVLLKGTDDVLMQTAACQGARPFGDTFEVTAASGNIIEQLNGEPAYQVFVSAVRASLGPEDAILAERGVLIGKAVVPEDRSIDAYAIRSLLSADVWNGTMTIGERVKIGDVIRFHLPDAAFAQSEMIRVLDLTDDDEYEDEAGKNALLPKMSEATSQLLFVDSNRAGRFFDPETNDAMLINDIYPHLPTAGVIADATFAPSVGVNTVHGLAATSAVFTPS